MKNVTLQELLTIKRDSLVLVLNQSFEPLNLTSWKRAIVLLLKNRAVLISEKVIRLVKYIRIPGRHTQPLRPSRAQIYKRDNHSCQYCGSTRSITLDHVIPSSRGGEDTWQNLVTCCSSCNVRKADYLLSECGFELKKRPKAPFNSIVFTLKSDEEWRQYCYG